MKTVLILSFTLLTSTVFADTTAVNQHNSQTQGILKQNLQKNTVATYSYLVSHPEKMSEFFTTNPTMLDKFNKYLDYHIANAKTQEEYDSLYNVKRQLDGSVGYNVEEDIKLDSLKTVVLKLYLN